MILVFFKRSQGFGGEACLIDSPCRTGTDRVAKATSQSNCDVIINLQGDEIPLQPKAHRGVG